jgi:predicted membrane channel-forming protein YqfA (hemolysin III family)
MGIGFSIFLLAVGAILTFAVHATVAGIDIRVVGVILMAAGALGIVLTMVVFTPRRNRSVTATHTVEGTPSPAVPQRVTDQEVRTNGA